MYYNIQFTFGIIICLLSCTSVHTIDDQQKQIEIAYALQAGRSIVNTLYQEPHVYWASNGQYYTLDTIATYDREGADRNEHQMSMKIAHKHACDLLYDACLPLRASHLDHLMRMHAWSRHRNNNIHTTAVHNLLTSEETARTNLVASIRNCNEINNVAEDMLVYLHNLAFTLD